MALNKKYNRHVELPHPLICVCDESNPIPDGLGECANCHRLIPDYSYRQGARPSLPRPVDNQPWLPPDRRKWRPWPS